MNIIQQKEGHSFYFFIFHPVISLISLLLLLSFLQSIIIFLQMLSSSLFNIPDADMLSSSNLWSAVALEAVDIVTNDFQDVFIYGLPMYIYHKGKPKQMNVYLDHKRQMLLWVSSQTKAFMLDLYFCKVSYKQTFDEKKRKQLQMQRKQYMFSLTQLEQKVIFLFETASERKKYFKMFNLYIDQLKRKYPHYCSYFSNINKLDSKTSTENGYHLHSQKQILAISKKVGLSNERENKFTLQSCMKLKKITNKQDIPIDCIDEYFRIQFCNRSLQPVFETFSKEKIGDIIKNPEGILKPVMSLQQFAEFLREHQKQKPKKITQVLKMYKQDISFFDFCLYLYNNQYNSIGQLEQNDESYPLKDYYCFSSHNTYLTGNQLNSDCQVERYAQDLQNGIKCVELDIHNSGKKPIITHAINGAGFCKPIDFEDVIKVIDLSAEKFISNGNSHYPIILSLENHASNENKEMMLNIMMTHFGSTLYFLSEARQQFPSLQFLKGKIIVKTSSSQSEMKQFQKIVHRTSSPLKRLNSNGNWVANQNIKRFHSSRLQKSFNKFQEQKAQLEKQRKQFNERAAKIQQIYIPITSMTKITVIFKSQKGLSPGQSQFACLSLENGAVLKKNKNQLISYTSNSWLRTYPHASQFKSKNYDPAQMLTVGAQIIALNTQTKDDYAWMMYRYFCAGPAVNLANRGYVLKPERLRVPEKLQSYQKKLHKLVIQLIQTSGQKVAMRFLGLPSDMTKNAYENSGKNNFSMEFTYQNPDESFIIFDIGEQYRDCVALRWVCQGYRVLQARNRDNYVDSGKRILVNVKLTIHN